MSLDSGFWDSMNGDRVYSASDFNNWSSETMTDGVIRGFEVTNNAYKMQLEVSPGIGVIDGHWFKSDKTVQLGLSPRTDKRFVDLIAEMKTDERLVKFITTEWTGSTPGWAVNGTGFRRRLMARFEIPTNATNSRQFKRIDVETDDRFIGYASSRLNLDVEGDKNVNSLALLAFRGANLGSSLTEAQLRSINNGSFKNLYLGDYWIINGIRWRIIDFNYFHGYQNHVVVAPDRGLTMAAFQPGTRHRMQHYFGSTIRKVYSADKNISDPIKNFINREVGGYKGEILQYYDYLVNGINTATGEPNQQRLVKVGVELMTVSQYLGLTSPLTHSSHGSHLTLYYEKWPRQFKMFNLYADTFDFNHTAGFALRNEGPAANHLQYVGGAQSLGLMYLGNRSSTGYRPYIAITSSRR